MIGCLIRIYLPHDVVSNLCSKALFHPLIGASHNLCFGKRRNASTVIQPPSLRQDTTTTPLNMPTTQDSLRSTSSTKGTDGCVISLGDSLRKLVAGFFTEELGAVGATGAHLDVYIPQ